MLLAVTAKGRLASVTAPSSLATVNPIQSCPLPETAVLTRYAAEGGYADCFRADVDTVVTLPQYLVAFYTSPLFRFERLILRWAIRRPSTDAEASQLAHGETDRYAAWTVEDRDRQQLLMCDLFGSTRSWFMVQPRADGAGTRLYFGSAVLPTRRSVEQGRPRMGLGFRLLLGFYRLYSRALLRAAVRRLRMQAG